MMNLFPAVLALLLAAPSFAGDADPAEIARFIERREVCEYYRQEPWPEGSSADDRERRAFLSARFGEFCKGSDGELGELKRRYRDDPAVMERLGRYEDRIEGQ